MSPKDNDRIIHIPHFVGISWNELIQATHSINPGVKDQDWAKVGAALKYADRVTDSKRGFSIFREWSRERENCPIYIESWWDTFPDDNPLSLTRLLKMAENYGWDRRLVAGENIFKDEDFKSPEYILDCLTDPPPDIDLELFPELLVTRSKEVALSRGCDPLVPLWAGLGAVCAAADARSRLELLNGWKVPPLLWLMTIGSPAEKKTPASKPMLSTLNYLEIDDRPRFYDDLLKWEAHEAAYASSKKAFNAAAADPANFDKLDSGVLPPVHNLPPRPIPLRMVVTDITSQKMVRLAAERPRGLLCWLDEMRSWMDKVSDRNSGEDRSCWTTSYEADPYRMDRVGDGKGEGSIMVDNFAIAIYGNVQPEVLKEKMPLLAADGLLQRFIPAVLRPSYTKRGEDIPEELTHSKQWDELIRRIFSIGQKEYKLDPDAYHSFRNFQLWYEQVKADERILNSSSAYMGALGKLEGTCGRMIFIFHLMTDPENELISQETTKKAIKLTKEYIVPALRYMHEDLSGHNKNTLERWVAEYICSCSGEIEYISLAQLRASSRARHGSKSGQAVEMEIRLAMHQLSEAGWVRQLKTGKTTSWAINPAVAKAYAAHREMIILARQKRLDLRIIKGRGKVTNRMLAMGYDPDVYDDEEVLPGYRIVDID